MPRMQVAVMVDAGYLYKAGGQVLFTAAGKTIGLKGVPRRELALDAVVALRALQSDAATRAPEARWLRAYWYDAARLPLAGDHLALAECAGVKLRLGTMNSAGEQKQVDALIITDMMSLSQKGALSDIILVSGDIDLLIGVQFAQEHGVRVHLRTVAPTRANTNADLRQSADTLEEWVTEDVKTFLRIKSSAEMTAALDADRKRTPVRRSSGSESRSADAKTMLSPASTPSVEKVTKATEAKAQGDDSWVVKAIQNVLPNVEPTIMASIAVGSSGNIPGAIDRQLIGSGKFERGGAFLDEPDKRKLRQAFREACVEAVERKKPDAPKPAGG